MKYVIITVLVIVLGLIGYGYYLENDGNLDGKIYIGIGVLVVAFVLMPLFIFHRYKNKDLSKFKFNNQEFQKRNKEQGN